ncbi:MULTISPECIES: hypothetical protein [Kamptonema]|jgi:hypothetical protein|uniref:hypothetical protein n=1 Tax=Kamptonema TaxID=1501433 RepID=UPI0001DAD377|nr:MULTISPECIES: hypothetical protein [Kamptonema]CBN57114.1 hypothetical protein OSCI_3320006 [Kamptonema sp. PCC 6506]
MTNVTEVLKSAQFVVDASGKKTAVQLSVAAWEALLDWIEDREDEGIFREAMSQLREAGGSPEKAGWLDWEAVKDDWEKD